MANAAKKYEPEADTALERAAAGERVVICRDGTELAAVVPIEDLRRLQELEAEGTHDSAEPGGLDLFISMAGQVRSGESDISADKYRHLAGAYASKP